MLLKHSKNWLRRIVAFKFGGPITPDLPIGFVDCVQEPGKAGRFFYWPQTFEVAAEQLDVTLGEKPDCNYTFAQLPVS